MNVDHIPWFRLGARSVLWFALAFGLLFLVRVPLLLIHYVPYHLPFEPWVALIPLLGVIWGAPAVLAVGAATALGDWMAGLRGALPVWHVAGMMAWAWSARALWIVRVPLDRDRVESGEPRVTWLASLYFLGISIPGALVAASVTALGADLSRSYSYSYAAFITAGNHVAFLLVFAVALYRVFEREVVPRFGSLDGNFPSVGHRPSRLGFILQVLGALGAWGIGCLAASRWGYPARGPAVLGDTVGLRLLPGVLPFLLLFVFGLFCPPTKQATPDAFRRRHNVVDGAVRP